MDDVEPLGAELVTESDGRVKRELGCLTAVDATCDVVHTLAHRTPPWR